MADNLPVVRRPGALRLALRRVRAHLFRYTARWAYALVAVCVLLYAVVPDGWQFSDTVRQFVLILASVAVGAIVLPELPSNLWTIDADRVRNLIPSAQRERLAMSLIEADADDARWANLAWTKGLEPLLRAGREPWLYAQDMDYDVSLHLGRTDGQGPDAHRYHLASVTQKSYRMLGRPGVSSIWLSISRTSAALSREFLEPGCLARELVPLEGVPDADWQEAILATSVVEMYVDGAPVPLHAEALPESPDVVRWLLPLPEDVPRGVVRLHIRFDFRMDASVDSFPVMFSGYYCAGTTEISLRLYDENQPSVLESDYFVGRALEVQNHASVVETTNDLYKQVTFSTGKEAILWPGSGVLFRWRDAV